MDSKERKEISLETKYQIINCVEGKMAKKEFGMIKVVIRYAGSLTYKQSTNSEKFGPSQTSPSAYLG